MILKEKNRHEVRMLEIAAVISVREQAFRKEWKEDRDQVSQDTQQIIRLERKALPDLVGCILVIFSWSVIFD